MDIEAKLDKILEKQDTLQKTFREDFKELEGRIANIASSFSTMVETQKIKEKELENWKENYTNKVDKIRATQLVQTGLWIAIIVFFALAIINM